MPTRAYELLTIFESEVEQPAIDTILKKVDELVVAGDGKVATLDNWGRKRFAYPIDHKWEGTYVLHEIVTEATNLDDVERALRLADEVVRHKLMRLPEHEGQKRGLLEGGAAPAETTEPAEAAPEVEAAPEAEPTEEAPSDETAETAAAE